MRLNGAPGIVGQLIYVVPAEHCSCQHLRWAVSQSPTIAVLYWQQPLQCGTVRLRSSLCWPYIESFGVTIVSPPFSLWDVQKQRSGLIMLDLLACDSSNKHVYTQSCTETQNHRNEITVIETNYPRIMPFYRSGTSCPFKSRIDYWHRQPPAHQKSQRSFL